MEQERIVKDSNNRLEALSAEFEEFKLNHNLDEYFKLNLSDKTREETVK